MKECSAGFDENERLIVLCDLNVKVETYKDIEKQESIVCLD